MEAVSTKEHILELENERITALLAGDVETIRSLMSEDLVHIHGRGHLDRLDAYLDGVASKFRFHAIERGELIVRDYGDVVVVNGPLRQTVSVNGVDKKNELTAIVTQTWIRSGGEWKQSTCHMHFVDHA